MTFEFTPIVPAMHGNGISRTMIDPEAHLEAELVLGFDPIEEDPVCYGIDVFIRKANADSALKALLTSDSRTTLIRNLQSDTATAKFVKIALDKVIEQQTGEE